MTTQNRQKSNAKKSHKKTNKSHMICMVHLSVLIGVKEVNRNVQYMWKALFKLLHTLVQYTVQLYVLTISKKASSCEVGILVIHSIHNVKDYMVYFGQYNKIACWQLKFVVNGLVLTCYRWMNSKIVLSVIELQKQIKPFSFHPPPHSDFVVVLW